MGAPAPGMSDRPFDELARNRAPHHDERDPRGDSGRPVDHRRSPGAFDDAPRPIIPSMEVRDDVDVDVAEQDPGQIHRPAPGEDPALAYPPPEHPPLTEVAEPGRTEKTAREKLMDRAHATAERARRSPWIRSAAETVVDWNRRIADRIESWLHAS